MCLPSTEQNGLASAISEHFGRAPFHYIVDTETEAVQLLPKPEGEHGHCVPVQALIAAGVKSVVCKGIGRGAVMNFTNAGIPVLNTQAQTIQDAVQAFKGHSLAPVDDDNLCAGHDHDHDHCH